MEKIAVISAILEEPEKCQAAFNEIVTGFKGIIRGRMGVPLQDYGMTVVALTVIGNLDDINSLTGKLGRLEGVSVKTSIAKKAIG